MTHAETARELYRALPLARILRHLCRGRGLQKGQPRWL